MILSDHSLRIALKHGYIKLAPDPEDHCIQPGSIDVRLGSDIKYWKPEVLRGSFVNDPRRPKPDDCFEIHNLVTDGDFVMYPGRFIIAHTFEAVGISDSLVGQLNGKSSLGREGLTVHSTAGYLDPGFHGEVTLELELPRNVPPFNLYYQMPIAQLVFFRMTTQALRPYGSDGLRSRYQNNTGAQESLFHVDKNGAFA